MNPTSPCRSSIPSPLPGSNFFPLLMVSLMDGFFFLFFPQMESRSEILNPSSGDSLFLCNERSAHSISFFHDYPFLHSRYGECPFSGPGRSRPVPVPRATCCSTFRRLILLPIPVVPHPLFSSGSPPCFFRPLWVGHVSKKG